jgi:hypothetical protein
MGLQRKFALGKSLIHAAKNFAALRRFALLVAGVTSLSCAQKVYAPLAEKNGKDHGTYKERTSLGIKLTDVGINHSPQFNLSEDEILFISEKRKTHAQPQLYSMDLGSFREKRLTFQDGHIYDAIAIANNEVSYSSTTDEYKERPLLFYPDQAKQKFPGTEIYLSNAQGLSINRLTQEPGFDGILQRHPLRPDSLIFSKWHEGALQLWQLNTKSKARLLLRSVKDRNVAHANFSAALKKWLWTETLIGGESEIWTGDQRFQKAERLNISFSQAADPQWIPGQPRISFLTTKENKTEALFWDLQSQCLGEILKHNDLIYALRWSKSAAVIVARDNDERNLFYRTLDLSTLKCRIEPPAVLSQK